MVTWVFMALFWASSDYSSSIFEDVLFQNLMSTIDDAEQREDHFEKSSVRRSQHISKAKLSSERKSHDPWSEKSCQARFKVCYLLWIHYLHYSLLDGWCRWARSPLLLAKLDDPFLQQPFISTARPTHHLFSIDVSPLSNTVRARS